MRADGQSINSFHSTEERKGLGSESEDVKTLTLIIIMLIL